MLKPKDIAAQTGWSLYRVLRLIHQGKIPAVNTGTGCTPRWEVRQCDLDDFLTPAATLTPKSRPIKQRTKSRLSPDEQAELARIRRAVSE